MMFSEMDISKASDTSLVDYLRNHNEKLVRSGGEHKWITPLTNSTTIRGNMWYRHSTAEGGDAIDFLQHFYGLSFQEAVTSLTSSSIPIVSIESKQTEHKSSFVLPRRCVTNDQLKAYLCGERCIDESVIDHFINQGLLYEDNSHHNCVFVGIDDNEVPRYAFKRSTERTSNFRQDVSGSNKKTCCFMHRGSSNLAYVFEAHIDMLSYISLHPVRWQNNTYLSLGGLSSGPLDTYFKSAKHIDTLIFCFDNDVAGLAACEKHEDLYLKMGYDVRRDLPLQKDWNEQLVVGTIRPFGMTEFVMR